MLTHPSHNRVGECSSYILFTQTSHRVVISLTAESRRYIPPTPMHTRCATASLFLMLHSSADAANPLSKHDLQIVAAEAGRAAQVGRPYRRRADGLYLARQAELIRTYPTSKNYRESQKTANANHPDRQTAQIQLYGMTRPNRVRSVREQPNTAPSERTGWGEPT